MRISQTALKKTSPAIETLPPLKQVLKDFPVVAEAEVRSLASLYSVVGRSADALAPYFGEDPARCPFEQARPDPASENPVSEETGGLSGKLLFVLATNVLSYMCLLTRVQQTVSVAQQLLMPPNLQQGISGPAGIHHKHQLRQPPCQSSSQIAEQPNAQATKLQDCRVSRGVELAMH
ncbi:hypothetical protein C5167_006864 [Papaver somniferum]|uniref:Uncharacterized protein n=1 Tax=Papaver somniferum TaxID=3469 RepID=A0A4Y7JID0_PAPSO|nr:hypothetical protein C5167_006864 [Papaver somniferum]